MPLKNQIQRISTHITFVLSMCFETFAILVRAAGSGRLRITLRALAKQVGQRLKEFPEALVSIREMGDLQSPSLQSLKQKVTGLHALLPDSEGYTFSILIPVYHPDPQFLKKAVQSALDQSSPRSEILIGLDGPQPARVMAVLEDFKNNDRHQSSRLKIHFCDRMATGGGISRTTNELARLASGKYLFLMDHDDWIRPDLLYRYELILRLHKNPENVVLYCNEYKIDEHDAIIPDTYLEKPEHPIFPYLFVNFICHGLLIPKRLWERVDGLRPETDGSQDFDLCLRLDLAGAQFQNVPFLLYAWRSHQGSTAKKRDGKDYATPAGMLALKDYYSYKGLDWEIHEGLLKTTYRAIPRTTSSPLRVHVIIPYKDQKELTLNAVRSAMNQKNVQTVITAIDNGSLDQSIGKALIELGAEVLRVDEPFNYSRLNNYGAKNSIHSNSTECLLFLNNDVELDSHALEEMCRWISQPRIGMVGARLHYPDGRMQHGGITLELGWSASTMKWVHRDSHRWPSNLGFSMVTSICDAVTAACLLIKRDVFYQIGCFDEIWYPIGYSDTDLATKARRIGLYPLYTPYAHGLHHESQSRGPEPFVDAESSFWYLRATENRFQPQTQLRNHIFLNNDS